MKHDQRKARGPASRVLLLGLVLILALTPLLTLGPGGIAAPPAAVAASKSRNKNKQAKQAAAAQDAACQIKKSKTSWKLQANCTITAPITIPNGVTFDGNGKTITMTGAVSNFASTNPDVFLVDPAILAAGGTANIRDLTIVGSGLTGECYFDTPAAITFANTVGTIEKVTIRDIRIDGPPIPCGYGIDISGTPTKRIVISDTVVSGSPTRGISAFVPNDSAAILELRKTRVTMSDIPLAPGTAIDTVGTISLSLDDVTVDAQITQGLNLSSAINMTMFGNPSSPRLTVKNLRVQGAPLSGLAVGAFDLPTPMAVTIDKATIASTLSFGSGVSLAGSIHARIKDSAIGVPGYSGLGVFGATVAVDDTTIAAGDYGINLSGGAVVSIDDATISQALNGAWVAEASTLNLDDVIIKGRGATPDQAFGVFYGSGSGGFLDDVAISGFIDTAPETVSCGVAIASDAGDVDLDDVSFPSPGNEQDICDPVTVSAASQQLGDERAASLEALATADTPVATDASTAAPTETTATASPTSGSDITAQPAPASVKEKVGKKGKDKHKGKAKSRNKKGKGNGKARIKRGGN